MRAGWGEEEGRTAGRRAGGPAGREGVLTQAYDIYNVAMGMCFRASHVGPVPGRGWGEGGVVSGLRWGASGARREFDTRAQTRILT